MTYQLRPYQADSVKCGLEFLRTANAGDGGLLVEPTGAGKALIIASVCEGLDAPSIVFQPSVEILGQNLEKLRAFGRNPGIYSAAAGEKRIRQITLATIGSVVRKANLFRDFKYVIIDESHLVGARNADSMFMRFLSGLPEARILGLTATPYRLVTDGYGGSILKFLTRTRPRIFTKVLHVTQNGDLLRDGYWAKLEYKIVQSGFRAERLRLNSTGADYTDESVRQHFKELHFSDQIVRCVNRVAELGRGPVLVFTRFVEEARYVASRVVGAAIVTADTPADTRKAIIRQFKSGQIQCVANVNCLCLDGKTEILTSDGWTGKNEMTMNHKIACWSKDGNIMFQRPKGIIVRTLESGEVMVACQGKGKDFRVTGNHRMCVGRQYGRNREVRWEDATALEIVGKEVLVPVAGNAKPFHIKVKELLLSRKAIRRREVALAYSYRKRGLTNGDGYEDASKTIKRKLEMRAKTPSALTLDECRFVGFWLGDGSISKGKSGSTQCSLCQSLTYPAIITWVDKLLERMGYGYSRHLMKGRGNDADAIRWSINRGTGSGGQKRPSGFYLVEPLLDKRGSSQLWGLSSLQFAALLEGFWFADGNHGDGVTPCSRGCRVLGAQKALYDLLQAIGVCRGYCMTVTECKTANLKKQPHWLDQYCLYWRKMAHRQLLRERAKTVDAIANEEVWCVESETGYIVTRRNGKVSIVGNSIGFDYPELANVILAAPTRSLARYYQFVGRAVRPHPSKVSAFVIDMVGLVEQFGKVEDFRLVCGPHEKWVVENGQGKQLTNCYFSQPRNGSETTNLLPFARRQIYQKRY